MTEDANAKKQPLYRYTIVFQAFADYPRRCVDSVEVEVTSSRRITESDTKLEDDAWGVLYEHLAKHPEKPQINSTATHWELDASSQNWKEQVPDIFYN